MLQCQVARLNVSDCKKKVYSTSKANLLIYRQTIDRRIYSGKMTVTLVPLSESLVIVIVPRKKVTICLTTDSPRPEPTAELAMGILLRKKRSKMCGKSLAAIALPLLLTSRTMLLLLSMLSMIEICPAHGVYFSALSIRLLKI